MIELDEEAQLLVSMYLKGHPTSPVRGSGSVRLEFQAMPATRRPVLEPLLHSAAAAAWYVRWPNGSLRWETESRLQARGFPVPGQALVAELGADGQVEPRWQPPLPDELQ